MCWAVFQSALPPPLLKKILKPCLLHVGVRPVDVFNSFWLYSMLRHARRKVPNSFSVQVLFNLWDFLHVSSSVPPRRNTNLYRIIKIPTQNDFFSVKDSPEKAPSHTEFYSFLYRQSTGNKWTGNKTSPITPKPNKWTKQGKNEAGSPFMKSWEISLVQWGVSVRDLSMACLEKWLRIINLKVFFNHCSSKMLSQGKKPG